MMYNVKVNHEDLGNLNQLKSFGKQLVRLTWPPGKTLTTAQCQPF